MPNMVKITVVKMAEHKDLMDLYELPMENACSLQLGETLYTDGIEPPESFCPSAWQSISPYAFALAHGAENLHGKWMKNPASAMVSCNDGFRPVSFYLEAIPQEHPADSSFQAESQMDFQKENPI